MTVHIVGTFHDLQHTGVRQVANGYGEMGVMNSRRIEVLRQRTNFRRRSKYGTGKKNCRYYNIQYQKAEKDPNALIARFVHYLVGFADQICVGGRSFFQRVPKYRRMTVIPHSKINKSSDVELKRVINLDDYQNTPNINLISWREAKIKGVKISNINPGNRSEQSAR